MDNRPITTDERLSRLHDPALQNPEKVTLECGHEVWNKVGQVIFNYYDMVLEVIIRPAVNPDLTNSPKMPNGVTYWLTSIDCTRACCVNCAAETQLKGKLPAHRLPQVTRQGNYAAPPRRPYVD